MAAPWIQGARPRTLPAAVAPVLVGTGVAAYAGSAVVWKALLALVVAVALQVGVNYANDYSDGTRGTDARRAGPVRLVGSGLAEPAAVRRAAFAAFAVAAAGGLVLAATTDWWLLAVGALALLAAWFYTGGARPYGYRGLGEVSVFVFFGLVAVVGTAYVQTRSVPAASLLGGAAVGALACAILVANNLRDRATDQASGKRTLAVIVGDRRTRLLYVALLSGAYAGLAGVALLTTAWAWLGLASLPWAWRAARPVVRGSTGRALLPTLGDTGLAELVFAAGLTAGLLLA